MANLVKLGLGHACDELNLSPHFRGHICTVIGRARLIMGILFCRHGIRLLKVAVLALVVWGGHRTIAEGFTQLRQNSWEINQLRPGRAVIAGALYLISQFPSGWFWHGVLNALGQFVGLLKTMRGYYIGHLGKYVPGKALVILLRAYLVGGPSCNMSLAVVAVFYETFTTMAVGAVLAAAILLAMHRDQTYLILGALGLAAVVGVPTLPAVFVRLMRWINLPESTVASPSALRLSWWLWARGWFTIAVGWVLAGASLWATVQAIGVDGTNLFADLPIYTATVALSVAAGFVSMLPAGLGVREIVLLQLLAPQLDQLMPAQGERMALIAVIVLRLTWLAAEIVLAAILYPLRNRSLATSGE